MVEANIIYRQEHDGFHWNMWSECGNCGSTNLSFIDNECPDCKAIIVGCSTPDIKKGKRGVKNGKER